jgi:hypothetical protein
MASSAPHHGRMTLWEALFTGYIGLTLVLLLANVLFGFRRQAEPN